MKLTLLATVLVVLSFGLFVQVDVNNDGNTLYQKEQLLVPILLT